MALIDVAAAGNEPGVARRPDRDRISSSAMERLGKPVYRL